MTNLEMIQRFQNTFNTTYTVAKDYLEKHDWDILEAFVAYERSEASAKTKVTEELVEPKTRAQAEPKTAHAETVELFEDTTDVTTTKQDTAEEEPMNSTYKKQTSDEYQYTYEKKSNEKVDHGQGFIAWVKRNYAKAQKHRLQISRKGEEITSMKLTTLFWLIILAVVTFFSTPFLLAAFIVSLFFGVNYQVEGPGEVRHINYTFDKVTNWVDNTFKEKEDDSNRYDS